MSLSGWNFKIRVLLKISVKNWYFWINFTSKYYLNEVNINYAQLKQNKFKFIFDVYILYQMELNNGGRHGLHAKLVQKKNVGSNMDHLEYISRQNMNKSALSDFAVQYITDANKYRRILKEILAAEVHTSFSLHSYNSILLYTLYFYRKLPNNCLSSVCFSLSHNLKANYSFCDIVSHSLCVWFVLVYVTDLHIICFDCILLKKEVEDLTDAVKAYSFI